ncbi:VOC family protein [Lignipirellula cremea]|uniref:Glyoxalase-like domain protein n=1 Tax=Lignipirellula cremea TaxID=2528010 RepID=A0A518DX32_9BACT|nr:VOC family protein [Lignipirellula cremea]QDU96398.1 Glyoxalase-like domain protein [Lignipirellula cremea]
MSSRPAATRVTTIACMRYQDASKAIDFLCSAFGFERQLVVPGAGNEIMHAQLTFGNGMIMLGTDREDDFGKLMTTPTQVDNRCTQSLYVIVQDADAHHDQAVAAGAQVLVPLKDEDYGGRGYTCRDLEGHVWTFGTYDPWAEVTPS